MKVRIEVERDGMKYGATYDLDDQQRVRAFSQQDVEGAAVDRVVKTIRELLGLPHPYDGLMRAIHAEVLRHRRIAGTPQRDVSQGDWLWYLVHPLSVSLIGSPHQDAHYDALLRWIEQGIDTP